MKLSIIFLVLLLSGCHACKPIIQYEYVDVYVEKAVVPELPDFENATELDLPIYELIGLNPEHPEYYKIVSESYFNTVVILLGEIRQRDVILNKLKNFEEGKSK